LDGVVVADKPAGVTSHDVVDEVRRRLGTRKVGHAGTLDPDATGVLLLGVGAATRFLSYAQSAPKRYLATAVFGVTTSTGDASGAILQRRPVAFTRAELDAAVRSLTGDIMQVPPMVSAVKVGGERLYKKARRGEEVERPARSVSVYSLEVVEADDRGHQATISVHCSAGTYVRTVVSDLGAALGCGAHCAWLRRTEAGGFTEAEAVPPSSVEPASLRPLGDVVRVLPGIEVDESTARTVTHGRPLPVGEVGSSPAEGRLVAMTIGGRLLGVYRRKGDLLLADRIVPPRRDDDTPVPPRRDDDTPVPPRRDGAPTGGSSA